MPAFVEEVVAPLPDANQHAQVLGNFVEAVLGRNALLTPVEEGVASVELANAMLLSAWQGRPVSLPLDAAAYQQALQQKIEAGGLREPEQIDVQIDMDQSYR